MIKQAELVAVAAADRVQWTNGFIEDAAEGPFAGATCLLTLHFVPDDGGKLATLKEVRRRLMPGAAFVLVDLCLDKRAPDYQTQVGRYGLFATESGAPREDVDRTCERLQIVLDTVGPARNVQLLGQAGFKDPELFYAGMGWRGWVSYA